MKKIIFIVISLLLVLLGSECLAFQPAVIGGIRHGVALGLALESGYSNSPSLRYGFEVNTSNTPGIVFIGGKWFLSNIDGKYPMSLSAGAVGYLGNNSQLGPYISLVFDRFMGVKPLFLEFGVDAVNSGQLQLQLGYYF